MGFKKTHEGSKKDKKKINLFWILKRMRVMILEAALQQSECSLLLDNKLDL